jgi:NitT/TauT family transport system substrate-binding protein
MRLDPAGNLLPKRSRRATRARALLAAASGLAVLGAAGCGGAAGSTGGSVTNTITIAAVPGVENAPIFLAQKEGLFAAAGLKNVVIRKYSNEAAELTALQNAQADIAASDYGNIFYQQWRWHNLRILGDGYDAGTGVLEILTLPGSSIKSPLDLAGQRIGLPSDSVVPTLAKASGPISLDAAAATQVLENYLGNDTESVMWEQMSQAREVSELQHKKLMAILVSEPYIYEAQSRLGAVEVLDACSGSTSNLPLDGYVAMSAWVKQNPTAVADFQQALATAQGNAAMTGQVQQLLPSTTGMTAQDADLIAIGSYPTSTSVVSLERVVRLLTDPPFSAIKTTPNAPPPAVPPMIVRG